MSILTCHMFVIADAVMGVVNSDLKEISILGRCMVFFSRCHEKKHQSKGVNVVSNDERTQRYDSIQLHHHWSHELWKDSIHSGTASRVTIGKCLIILC